MGVSKQHGDDQPAHLSQTSPHFTNHKKLFSDYTSIAIYVMEEPKYNPSRPMPDISLVYSYKLSNCPGKTIVGLRVDFQPNAMTPPHRHGGAAVSLRSVGSQYLL